MLETYGVDPHPCKVIIKIYSKVNPNMNDWMSLWFKMLTQIHVFTKNTDVLSGCVWEPGFFGFHAFWIHCAARKQEGSLPQMVSRDEELKFPLIIIFISKVCTSKTVTLFLNKISPSVAEKAHIGIKHQTTLTFKLILNFYAHEYISYIPLQNDLSALNKEKDK